MKKRFLAMLLSTLLVVNISACNYVPENSTNRKTESQANDFIEIANTIEIGNLKDKSTNLSHHKEEKEYESILKLYKELITDNDIDLDTLNQKYQQPFFYELYSLSVNIDSKKAGYALKDLNGDRIDELILLDDDSVLYAVFTLKSGEASLVDCFSTNNSRGGIDADGLICKESFSKGESWGVKVSKILKNGELDVLEFGVYNSDPGIVASKNFLYRNGNKEFVDDKIIGALYEQYAKCISYSTPNDMISKLNLNFIYI